MSFGDCKFSPPTIKPYGSPDDGQNDGLDGVWPQTMATHWCARWKSLKRPNMVTDQHRRNIFAATLSAVAIMCVVPPWTYTYTWNGTYGEAPAGYYFIFEPPEGKEIDDGNGVKMDITRLLIQCLVALSAGGVGLLLPPPKRQK